ncbi:hypothetical protein ACXWQT_09495, partial [Streptococcus pyogenes]
MSVSAVRNNETKGLIAIGERLRPGSQTNPGHTDPRVEAVVHSALETFAESIHPMSRYDAIISQIACRPHRGRPTTWVIVLACGLA